ncbi:hypothetical protein EYF80_068141 [Liparis tanakae]|uniref:Uncharacterized protein n=1 Tax=Liparis tanakae TaxID=230148 RepID=A0A4Z2DZ87_9TELE|nr:hypothetical protein EYF80_068141 [Liparis tanakae]
MESNSTKDLFRWRSRVQGSGFRVQGPGSRGPGVQRSRVQGSGSRGPGFRVQGQEVQGPGFRVKRSRVQGSGSRVQGSGDPHSLLPSRSAASQALRRSSPSNQLMDCRSVVYRVGVCAYTYVHAQRLA